MLNASPDTAQAPATDDEPVKAVVETLEDATEVERVCLKDIVSEFGTASFPPVLLALSVLLISPLSGVPLFSSAVGMAIFLVASQGMFGRRQIWMPRRLATWQLNTKRSDRMLESGRRLAVWLDRGTTSRWEALVSPPASRVLYGICAFSGLCLPMLELVPLSSSLVGLSVAFIATGLLARDGLVAVMGLFVLGGASMIPAFAYSAIFG
ncbi:exopolysaccharide biosynthesis protein [uncultured Tateyamaria sp.]|uniref:exopolysaccharide biosynthesis protein n=1 Tax=uncultured Tateyamaria sp. TaxID=455651 RepID=UPI00261E231F|nr:exopolysaccharide biosynthesis protein [uncultured Tateyamaria sp.]